MGNCLSLAAIWGACTGFLIDLYNVASVILGFGGDDEENSTEATIVINSLEQSRESQMTLIILPSEKKSFIF